MHFILSYACNVTNLASIVGAGVALALVACAGVALASIVGAGVALASIAGAGVALASIAGANIAVTLQDQTQSILVNLLQSLSHSRPVIPGTK